MIVMMKIIITTSTIIVATMIGKCRSVSPKVFPDGFPEAPENVEGVLVPVSNEMK